MITRGSGEIDWYSYDLPSKIDDLSDSSYAEFWYGPDRSRIRQYQSSGVTLRYAGTLFEFEDAATDTYRHYVQAGDKVIAVVERVATTNTRQYLHRDHQGSVVKVTNASGTVDQALAFDAWGLRRNASDWSALGSPFAGSHEIERGYTGHEHLDQVGLIHMNGRVQDPILGRFISADPFVQAPFNTQSHNRYSYVWNNPASMTDPSGFCGGYCRIDSEEMLPDVLVASRQTLPLSARVTISPPSLGRQHGYQDDTRRTRGTRQRNSSTVRVGCGQRQAQDFG